MKKILCSILCAGLLSAFTVLPASAAVPSEVPSESVVYMLTLDSPSLLDHVLSSDRYDSMKELIFSPEGKALSNKISNEQQQIQQAVTALLPDADFSKSRSFCAVTNGITFSAPLSAKKQLEKLPGVRSVKISGTTVVHTSAKTAPATATKVQKKAVYGSAQKATIDTKTAYDKGYTDKTELLIETRSGVKTLRLEVRCGKVRRVAVDMGRAVVSEDLTLEIDGISVTVTPVNVGNPHAVGFVPDADDVPLGEIGPKIEKHPAFPGGVNAEFVSLKADGGLRMRVWERGSGITMACGTGACASASAAASKGLCRTGERIPVLLDGGTLDIEVSRDFAVTMTGPAEFVYEGEIRDD